MEESLDRVKTWKCLAVLVIVALAANLPFVGQAFHMDDSIYLLIARNISVSPLFPMDRATLFEGMYASDLASTEHPLPLTSHVLALSARAFGGFTELAGHSAFLGFTIMLVASMYSVARKFTHYAGLATLTLLFLPVICVLSHTLMTDIPQLALWLGAVALFCNGVDRDENRHIWFGAAIAAVACFVSYSAFCLVLLLGFYAALRKHRYACRVAFIVPSVLFGGWLAFGFAHYHRFTPARLFEFYFVIRRVLAPRFVMAKAIYACLVIGSVTVFPPLLLVFSRRKVLAGGIVCAAAAQWFTGAFRYDLVGRTLFLVFFTAGFAAIAEVGRIVGGTFPLRLRHGDRGRDDLFLGTWFVGALVFGATAYLTGSARYLLPATPPFVLLLFRGWECHIYARRIATANLAFAGSLSILLAVADYQFAEVYRQFGSEFERRERAKNQRVWFTGEWGFRSYLENAGAEQLGRRDPRPKPGDIVVVPTLASPYRTLFDESLDLESIVLVAPSRVRFAIPPMPPDSVLTYTVGMPFHSKSDGLEFEVRFAGADLDRTLEARQVLPACGRRWSVCHNALRDVAGTGGSIVFAVGLGSTGNADGDWLAISRARISRTTGDAEEVLFDFREHLSTARIEAEAGVQYGTPANIPVFPMRVWLDQEPAMILHRQYDYHPALSLRLLDSSSHAGFWCMSWGMLPFSFSRTGAPLESIRVYQVVRPVDGYRESIPVWYAR
jgi:4-amino-4-deoxy-L-arabinose transferase-like glycosyltransferase